VAELDKVQSSRQRVALMNAITAHDFDRVAVETQFVAMMAKSDDPLRRVYLQRLESLLDAGELRLATMRAVYRNVSGTSHGRDPVK